MTKKQPTDIGHQTRLPDGRWLGYAEFGDPEGQPIFFFHGLPGSRLFRHPDDSIAAELGVRLITIDRPGFGLSSFKKKRKLLDWPDDVEALADALGIDRFAVAGVSAGGPYTAACAFKIPHRLTNVALISSAAPTQVPGITEGMSPRVKSSFRVAGCGCLPWWALWPTMFFIARTGRRTPEKLWQRQVDFAHGSDRELLTRPDVKRIFIESFPETYRQGPRGHIHDALTIARNWQFDVKNISTKVHLWHGTEDTAAPQAMGEYLANTIPHCQATFLSGEGHLLMFRETYWRDILTTLLA